MEKIKDLFECTTDDKEGFVDSLNEEKWDQILMVIKDKKIEIDKANKAEEQNYKKKVYLNPLYLKEMLRFLFSQLKFNFPYPVICIPLILLFKIKIFI